FENDERRNNFFPNQEVDGFLATACRKHFGFTIAPSCLFEQLQIISVVVDQQDVFVVHKALLDRKSMERAFGARAGKPGYEGMLLRESVLGNRATDRLANRAEGVGAAARADGDFGDVGVRADEIGPGRRLAVIGYPLLPGSLELIEVGAAHGAGFDASGADVPTGPGDGEDDPNCYEQSPDEFARLEADGGIVERLGWLVIHL